MIMTLESGPLFRPRLAPGKSTMALEQVTMSLYGPGWPYGYGQFMGGGIGNARIGSRTPFRMVAGDQSSPSAPEDKR